MTAFIYFIYTACMVASVHGWFFQCNTKNGYCTRVFSETVDPPSYPTLEICKLLCGTSTDLNLWPLPTGSVTSDRSLILTNIESIKVDFEGSASAKDFLQSVIEYFRSNVADDQNSICKDSYNMVISIVGASDDLSLTMATDESYTLKTRISGNNFSVEISADTLFGVRHGLETLLQLLVPYQKDDTTCLATLKSVELTDSPVYRHRGLLIDSARNFLSVDVIKKNIDAMAASKLNVLHWHVTDSQSFPLEIHSLPNMTAYGAYSDKRIYTVSEVDDLVSYARVRGVRILVEIDGPSHAGAGWQWGSEAGLGNLAVCVNQQPWRSFCIQPPCGQLNPANPLMYKVLGEVYDNVIQMFPDTGLFHMGGDEVYIPCWNSSQEVLDYIQDKPRTEETFLDLWAEFQSKALAAYDSAIGHNNSKIIVWTSHLTDPEFVQKYLPKERYIIQTWVPDTDQDLITSLLSLGYEVIISTKDKWYLDHGFWGNTDYYNWRTVYNNKMYNGENKSILGGEVCMWGELVDDSNIESRIWPRAAAAAERLWSNPSGTATSADGRFFSQRRRLVKRGLKTEAEMPQWCVQNEGECSTYNL